MFLDRLDVEAGSNRALEVEGGIYLTVEFVVVRFGVVERY